jgi:hypothetical protein
MGDSQESRAIGQRGFLIRGIDDQLYFRVYQHDNEKEGFVDYEITNYDCEVVIIDPHAAFFRGTAGDFLDYTTESMQPVK